MTKIDIISGFLGAGKTTFIRKLLEEAIAGEQVVLIENEFGEIGIDGGFLKDSGIEIREMNSGCICCSLVGDFGASLEEVLTKYQPDRVIIEPSGVGKLSDVMNAVRNVAKNLDVKLNSAVTIVDACKCRMYMKNFGEFFNNQVESAGTIVLSRTDVADTAKIQADVEMLRAHNAAATIITTPVAQLGGAQLLELIEKPDNMMQELLEQAKKQYEEHHHDEDEEECCCGHDHHHHHEDEDEHEHHHHHEGEDEHDHPHEHHHHEDEEEHEHHHHHHEHGDGCGHEHHHHDADEIFSSWGFETILPIEREKLDEILQALAYGNAYGDVLRAKGMLPGEKDGEWLYFDLVPEEYEIRIGAPDYTGKVCVIGSGLKEDELSRAFGR
ncbi:MAG: cobalamin biosynthesis protein CobW [Clostridiales bacterium]|nr:cobalamin biosynthesis protein CobW [Clostridiales bacterium]